VAEKGAMIAAYRQCFEKIWNREKGKGKKEREFCCQETPGVTCGDGYFLSMIIETICDYLFEIGYKLHNTI
jgi:hypothetical protein